MEKQRNEARRSATPLWGVRNDSSKSRPEIDEGLFLERKEYHRGLGKSAREEKVELVEYFPKK